MWVFCLPFEMEAKVENILRYKFITSDSPLLQSICILEFGLILPGKAVAEKIKMFVTLFRVSWSLVLVYTKWTWPNVVNMNTLQLTQELFQVLKKGMLIEKLSRIRLAENTASCEFCILTTPRFMLLLCCNKHIWILCGNERFLWFVFPGDCNFQKVLLNVLLPYLNYLLPRCAVLCTKNPSLIPWTYKSKMVCWVFHFILFFYGRFMTWCPASL